MLLKERLKETPPFFIGFLANSLWVIPFYWFYLTTDFGIVIDSFFAFLHLPQSRPDAIAFGSSSLLCL
jgi:hypothetical protein